MDILINCRRFLIVISKDNEILIVVFVVLLLDNKLYLTVLWPQSKNT